MVKQLSHWDKGYKSITMNIQLIQGAFSSGDTLELINEMIQIKIKYHENKIGKNSSEEDVKYREGKIKRLQNELSELRNNINDQSKNLQLDAIIKIEM